MLFRSLSEVSLTAALIDICALLVPALTHYGDRVLRTAYLDEGCSLLRTPPSSLSTERAYVMLPFPPAPQSDSDLGYDSDDSMPSLRYVSDSSDDDTNVPVVD